MTYVLIAAGLVFLLAGGEALVRGAVGVASRLGMSPLLIGLTLVGFGTSTPELLTSVRAALAGSPGVAVGNVIGSNTANILLILGVSALIYPLAAERLSLKRDGGVMLAAAVACLGLGAIGSVPRVLGGVMVGGLLCYIAIAYLMERRQSALGAEIGDAEDGAAGGMSLGVGLLFAALGLGAVMLGADFLVRGAMALAREAGIAEEVIGLTIVAVGTSLPELATSAVAAFRRNAGIAIGNVIGSNIYNVLGILGVTALVKPIPYPERIAAFDNAFMVAATVLFLAIIALKGRIGRAEGVGFLALYLGYVGWLAVA